MKLTSLSLTATLLAAETASASFVKREVCESKYQRRSWHTLTTEQKLGYIQAEQCLMSLPAKYGLDGPVTRYDEFVKLHVMAAPDFHYTGAFLPYHRMIVNNHYEALRTECNYNGPQPYWNETLDAGNFKSSIVLDPVTGFGGDGTGPKGCIQDGPFKDYISPIGTYANSSAHCISRTIDECQSSKAAAVYLNQCTEKQTFGEFWPCMEELPHDGLHQGIGGIMKYFGSPGDPLFYLHHAYVDKVWWDWQSANREARLYEISGQNQLYTLPPSLDQTDMCGVPPGGIMPPLEPWGLGAPGDPGTEVTLGHVLNWAGVLTNVTVGEIMDIAGGVLCYEYD
ncbi:Di-copper centre-containing protein [Periconia macrospinosa]|uniref:Di-copper centre-containing protein n=1 Tax=Periconia macrospinosa TaxID=97972 RepID=A0A2V1DYE3_9PLEO|nr:Di-copper centre-containing protein [Periconia macrospinosa]